MSKGSDTSNCLTDVQVAAARKLYSGPINPRTKEKIYSPLYAGGELGWPTMASSAMRATMGGGRVDEG